MAIINTNKKIKTTRNASSIQEKKVAEILNGRQTKNSGATMFDKGDVSVDGLFIIECKTKMNPSLSISIKKEWLDKLLTETLINSKPYYALAFNFGPGEKNHYIIDEDLFIKLCEALRDGRAGS